MMNEQLKNQFPEWTMEINKNQKLILTNDLDSLFTCAVLNKLFGCQIDLFYDFESLYWKNNNYNKKDLIGVDLAIEDKEIKTFCNHVTKMWEEDAVNPLSANLNNIAGIHGGRATSNYFRKYAGSTLMMILSLYDAVNELILDEHTELTEIQKMILVGVDSYFFGKHFANGEQFHKWQKAMGLELFNDALEKYSKKQLMDFQEEYNLKGTIGMEEDLKPSTTLDINFLEEHFPMLDFRLGLGEEFNYQYQFGNTVRQKFWTKESKHDLEGDVFSLSVINRDTVKYTTY